MSWYREFKVATGENPRTWSLFKEQIRARFRDSDFEYKLLSKMYNLQATGSQQEYTSKFMMMLSQSNVEMPEIVKRWLYQQNIRGDTSSYISQNIPTSLQETIEHAQRFEDARKPTRGKPTVPTTGGNGRQDGRIQQPGRSRTGNTQTGKPAASAPVSSSGALPEPTCFTCGQRGHKSPECPKKGTGAQKN
eukprot:jgi/Phyca11/103557/e_gw1.8.871.1